MKLDIARILQDFNSEKISSSQATDAIMALTKSGPALEEVLRDAWNDLLEKDDRTSPEETPDMLLITFEELREFMERSRH